jgi:hypothetical protein
MVSSLRLQPELDQAADGLTARHLFALGSDPLIDRRYLRRMPTLADLKSLPGSAGSAPFLCYHGCLCHKLW